MGPCPVRVEDITSVPEDGLDDVELSSMMEKTWSMRRSKSNPIVTALMTDEECGVVYIQTSRSIQEKAHSDYPEFQHIVTGGEQDGWYPPSWPAPLPSSNHEASLSFGRVMSKSAPGMPCEATSSQMFLPGLPSTGTSAANGSTFEQPIGAKVAFARPVAQIMEHTLTPWSYLPTNNHVEVVQEIKSSPTDDLRFASTHLQAALATVFQPESYEHKKDTRQEGVPLTTVMLRNIPADHSRNMVMDMLRSSGFADRVSFMYLPMNLRSSGNFGYAFVDFDSTEVAKQCKENLNGFIGWSEPSEKVLEVAWSDAQGLDSHIQRYRDSPIMHESLDDEYKPAIFRNGVRVAFPPPTKPIRAPRLRRCRQEKNA